MEKPTFADFDLPKQVNSALEKLEISEPTPIQLRSFSPIMSGRDVIYLPVTAKNNFMPELPKEKVDMIFSKMLKIR